VNREDLVRRFEAWLDNALSAEDPPSGIDVEILSALDADGPVGWAAGGSAGSGRSGPLDDGYTLWAAMTALTQEVKLQGRAFKELHDTLAEQATRTADEITAAYRERERDLLRETERRCRRDILNALIDLRDRLGRGLDSVRAVESEIVERRAWRWLIGRLGRSGLKAEAEKVAAVVKGYELGIDRLDQILDDWNAHPIRSEGQRFDPRRMNAVDKEESSAVAEGTVLEVYRVGYEWSGEIIRMAQVKVACALGVRDQGSGIRGQGSGFRGQGSGIR
jgi:molecular chaperone GrpE